MNLFEFHQARDLRGPSAQQPEYHCTLAPSATFSTCRRYRYTLLRVWETGAPLVMFVGLNPSTADEKTDDPTVRRCVGFARLWGFGGMLLTNLFALRSTDPRRLRHASDPIGPHNDAWIRRCREKADLIVAAWGSHGTWDNRETRVLKSLGEVHCLGVTKNGNPRHPLYLASSTRLKRFQ